MRAVITQVNPGELEQRRKLGLDRWDEMWEGVLHMSPSPAYEHQRIVLKLGSFLDGLVERRKRGQMITGLNVFNQASSEEDYRIPDLCFVAAGRESIIAKQGIEGGPDAVIEIRSPDDETYEKFDFFAKLGVREVIVVDRDTKKPEVFRLAGSRYVAVAPDREGWVLSETLRVRMRQIAGDRPRLVVEDLDDATARAEI